MQKFSQWTTNIWPYLRLFQHQTWLVNNRNVPSGTKPLDHSLDYASYKTASLWIRSEEAFSNLHPLIYQVMLYLPLDGNAYLTSSNKKKAQIKNAPK